MDIDETRFWAKVDRRGPDECWPWKAAQEEHGYGIFSVKRKSRLAHRVAFAIAHGHWPNPCGLHRCDTPLCCNPAHIFEGTQRDNLRDMFAKGRDNNEHKLTARDVQIIRVLASIGCTQTQIATRYGVDASTICSAVNRQTWTWVPDYDLSG